MQYFFGLAVHEMLLKVYSDENEDDEKQRTRFIKTINYSLWLSLLKNSLLLKRCIIFICIRSKDPKYHTPTWESGLEYIVTNSLLTPTCRSRRTYWTVLQMRPGNPRWCGTAKAHTISAEQVAFVGSDGVFISMKYFQVGR